MEATKIFVGHFKDETDPKSYELLEEVKREIKEL